MNPLTKDYISTTQLHTPYACAHAIDNGAVSGSLYPLLTRVKAGESPRLHLQTIYTDNLTREDGAWVLARRRSDAGKVPHPSQLGFSSWNTGKGRQA